MLVFISFFPLIVIIGYCILLSISKDRSEDEFFLFNNTSPEFLSKCITNLEKQNRADYSETKAKFINFHSDNKLDAYEVSRIKVHLLNIYFDHFKNRFIAFKKADWYLKIIYFVTLGFGFFYFNFILYRINHGHASILYHIGVSIGLFVVPVLFWLFQLIITSVFLSIFSSFSKKKTNFKKAQIILEELVKLLKPGGRSTPVNLGPTNNFGGIFRHKI